jgi:hypothetical protein
MRLSGFLRVVVAGWVMILLGVSGCIVVPEPGVGIYGGPGSPYYSPLYYDGYVVYYDTAGLPYYYLGGSPVYVPRRYREYDRLVTHYRLHQSHYDRWNVSHGPRFRGYRDPGHGAPPRHSGGPTPATRPLPQPGGRAAPSPRVQGAPRPMDQPAPRPGGRAALPSRNQPGPRPGQQAEPRRAGRAAPQRQGAAHPSGQGPSPRAARQAAPQTPQADRGPRNQQSPRGGGRSAPPQGQGDPRRGGQGPGRSPATLGGSDGVGPSRPGRPPAPPAR